jgi:hypothetical protein
MTKRKEAIIDTNKELKEANKREEEIQMESGIIKKIKKLYS